MYRLRSSGILNANLGSTAPFKQGYFRVISGPGFNNCLLKKGVSEMSSWVSWDTIKDHIFFFWKAAEKIRNAMALTFDLENPVQIVKRSTEKRSSTANSLFPLLADKYRSRDTL
jgi:hypothetical protein